MRAETFNCLICKVQCPVHSKIKSQKSESQIRPHNVLYLKRTAQNEAERTRKALWDETVNIVAWASGVPRGKMSNNVTQTLGAS